MAYPFFISTLRPYQRLLLCSLLLVSGVLSRPSAAEAPPPAAIERFFELFSQQPSVSQRALAEIDDSWRMGYVPILLELIHLVSHEAAAARGQQLLEKRTQQRFGYDINAWYQWLWQQEYTPHPHYAAFKSQLYGLIDPRFAAYFSDDRTTHIRLDEIRWGGVRQDGIPPLHNPRMIAATEADYLADDHIVFGIKLGDEARAYPKRILAWHEMFTDTIANTPVAGVYCTLCGTMILYQTEHRGTQHQLGTSGFLYRSNKLMYDRATQSLWNTIWGRPVVGPLAEQDIELTHLYVVTTTWGEWRRRHPKTQVLSLQTGHQRDYGEGVAYRDYFATDELMFTVPRLDQRLANKAEVLGLRLSTAPDQPLALASEWLRQRPLYHHRLGTAELVILTDASGAHRVYQSDAIRFQRYDGDRSVLDGSGRVWALSEAALTAPDGRTLPRLPAHRAFWFGWYAAYPKTQLIH